MSSLYKSLIGNDNILRGPPKKFSYELTLGEVLFDRLQSRGSYDLIIDSKTGEKRTAIQVLNEAISLASALKQQGFGPGDVIGISSENRLEYPIVILASLMVGVTLAPFNFLYTSAELKHTLNASKPTLIFCSPNTVNTISELKAQYPFIKTLVVFSDKAYNGDAIQSYYSFVSQKVSIEKFRCNKFNIHTTVAVILCSSGTTGLPKGVELTHFNLLAFVETIIDTRLINIKQNDIILGLPPFFHGFGYGVTTAICLGNCVKMVVMDQFNEKHFLTSIQNYKISVLWVPPPIVLILAKSKLVDSYDISSLREIRSGAAPLSAEISDAITKRLKIEGVHQGYGMTELSIACVFSPRDCFRSGSCGIISMGMELKISDLTTGQTLGAMKEGEICARGPLVMKGYIGNVQATKETIDNENWLHTGDIGYYDNDGFIYVVGRLKELIKYKGFQVAPAEIEAILLTNPKIADAAVIGIPDEEAGELPFAFIVLKSGTQLTVQEVTDFIADKVSPQKRLRGGVRFLKQIPKNPTGKILRRELQTFYKSKN